MTADKGPIEAVGGSSIIGVTERPALPAAVASIQKAHGELALVADIGIYGYGALGVQYPAALVKTTQP